MTKKTKKIKSRCSSCGERNKYGIEHWQGRDKTRCKNCGEFLDKDRDKDLDNSSNINSCKEVKEIKMENTNNQFSNSIYEATRSVRNNETIKKGKKKLWVISIFVLLMLGGLGMFANNNLSINAEPIFEMHGEMLPRNISLNPPWLNGDLCSKVTAVPSWSKHGDVSKGGYQAYNMGVDYLINNNITFLYSSTCIYCDKIISNFGNDWNRYVESELTKECW